MSPQKPDHLATGMDALRRQLELLNEEALRRDDAARAEERDLREQQLGVQRESENAAKQELARWVLRERFGVMLIGIGCAFAILLTFLPATPSKVALYGCALLCALLGARQKDDAQRKIARILPLLSADGLGKFRAQKW
jgi:Flp pilus assembly protein TadB